MQKVVYLKVENNKKGDFTYKNWYLIIPGFDSPIQIKLSFYNPKLIYKVNKWLDNE